MRAMNSLSAARLSDLTAFKLGHAQDWAAATGCTVILAPAGAVAGVDVRGGAPASRELALLDPRNMVPTIHAVVLSGGSAFGLDAAAGVMSGLEQAGIGFDVGCGKVPIVCGAALFDLHLGEGGRRPDQAMGAAACRQALAGGADGRCGNVGAGTGASVGKLAGPGRSCKSGLGVAAAACGDLLVAVVTAVNALGDVYDPASGRIIAGLRSEDGLSLADSGEYMLQAAAAAAVANPFSQNTTIGAVLTNARLTKAEAGKAAALAHDGLARTIFPVHTQADGDLMFCLASGEIEAPADLVGSMAAELTARAIVAGVQAAEPAFGLPAARDFQRSEVRG